MIEQEKEKSGHHLVKTQIRPGFELALSNAIE